MTKFEVHSVGSIHSGKEGGTFIQVDENYIPAFRHWMVSAICKLSGGLTAMMRMCTELF